MVAIAINAFRGEVPRTRSRLLGENFATKALNAKIAAGRLDPIKGTSLSHTSTISGAIQTIYRYRFGTDYRWLVFNNDVDVCRSPTANDSLGRFYYSGDGEPRMSTYADGISGAGLYPNNFFALGVVPPTTGAALAIVGGSTPTESRAYVQTFVTQYGEESGPSPALLATGFANGSWNLSNLPAPPANSGTVTSASMSGSTCSVVLNTVYGLEAGERLTIAGTTGITGLNATHTIQSVNTGTNTVTVTLTATGTAGAGTWARQAPHNLTGMTRRIYRTVGTGTDYKFVAEQAATLTSYADTITTPGTAITSLNTRTPPKRMTSMVALANGALAGLNGNELCFSEQFKPHSWPTINRYSFPAIGVALCPAGNSCIVLTDSNPYVAVATIPEAASVTRMETYAPCINKRGVADVGAGALYPSHDGLYLITPSEARNVTEKLFRYDEWQAEEPLTFIATYHDQIYYAIKGSTAKSVLAMDLLEPDSVRRLSGDYTEIYANPFDGKLYLGTGATILENDVSTTNRRLIEWESREFSMGAAVNLGAAKVNANFSEIVSVDTSFLTTNAAILASPLPLGGELGMAELNVYALNDTRMTPNPNASDNYCKFILKSGGVTRHEALVQNGNAFRLPSGFRDSNYTIAIEAKVAVFGVAVASTIKELSAVQL